MGNPAPTSTTRGKPKNPRNFPEDEEAAAKIAQTDAAMLQPLLEHTNAYLTGTLNKPAIDIDELNSLFCSTTGTRYAVNNCAKTASELKRYGLRD